MTEDFTFAEAMKAASLGGGGARRHRRPVTAYCPSAGYHVGPLVQLGQENLRHRGIAMPTPEVLVFVDRDHPEEPGRARLGIPNEPEGPQAQVRTLSVDPLTVEGRPAGLLTVVVRAGQRARRVRVLRIRAENADVLAMCHRARWSPTIYVAAHDGCCGFGGNLGRCENSVTPGESPYLSFDHPPRWWVTDHFWPNVPGERHPDVGDLAQMGFPFEVEVLGLVDEEWGHGWEPFGGATAFELTPRTMEHA